MVKSDTWLHKRSEFLRINTSHINPNSVDLTLGKQIMEWRVFNSSRGVLEGYTPDDEHKSLDGNRWHKRTSNLKEGDKVVFYPGSFYLCHSQENIRVPINKAAMLFLKSSAGRKGLEHSHAGWVDSGFEGQLTWEITTHLPCEWVIGKPMCQLVVIEAELPNSDYSETGRYQNQIGATEARIKEGD